ncbi:efflux RND transporter periplasmic adaptor subunit [Antarcticimicrobium sediminis]|uniref:Efflux RND transporter periplasmic adaptor subunit n=1 Tax=Antarcticimicrobium sediminis TaxID=2546227 RepID=A0A4R5EHZ2_9RHOB|nr:efflux RND transporter periplasmic adaptor subunit [Antarcticimicrobium sediminis]TDE34018.1 efflux RND transporter periplasmic adaptor subunit [Antarcticimicrobium sediminis]
MRRLFTPRAAGSGYNLRPRARSIVGLAVRMWVCAGVALSLAPLQAGAEEPLVVELVTATGAPDILSHSLTGEVVARNKLSASFPTGGRVAEVLFQEGDAVATGTPLARMDSVQQEQALRAAEAGLSTAQADHRQAIEDFDRQETLLERGATTRTSRDSAEDALRIAEGVLSQARADLDRAKKALEDTVLLAPTDATVIDRMVEPGQVVGAAQPVMELALGQEIDAIFNVPEVLLTRDMELEAIDLVLIEGPSEQFTGQLREISPLVDLNTGTVKVTISVLDPPENMAYGDAVRGTGWMQGGHFISLPYTALTATTKGPAVWIVNPETMAVSIRQIAVDRYTTERIIVASGLEDGALVVSKGAQLLFPGRIVRQMEVSQ